MKKSQFKSLLGKIEIEDGKLPFFENCKEFYKGWTSKTGEKLYLSDYLFFIKLQVENYQRSYKFGEIDLCAYINWLYPPTKEVEETSDLDKFDDYVRENFQEEDTIQIKDVLYYIENFKNDEVNNG